MKRSSPRRDEARRFLETELAKGPARRSDIVDSARRAGINLHTLEEVKGQIADTYQRERSWWLKLRTGSTTREAGTASGEAPCPIPVVPASLGAREALKWLYQLNDPRIDQFIAIAEEIEDELREELEDKYGKGFDDGFGDGHGKGVDETLEIAEHLAKDYQGTIEEFCALLRETVKSSSSK